MSGRVSILLLLSWALTLVATAQGVKPLLTPVPGGHWPPTPHAWVHAVTVGGDFAYVCVDQGLRILNIVDPTHPAEVGIYESPGHWQQVIRVQGNYAYLAYEGDDVFGLEVLDVRNPATPVRIGQCTFLIDDQPTDLELKGNVAYLVSLYTGLQVIDVSDPTRPASLTSYESESLGACCFRAISVQEDHAYLLSFGHLFVMEILDATNLVQVGLYTNVTQGDIQVKGNYAYIVSDSQPGFQVLDVSNPARPVLAGICCTNTLFDFAHVEVAGRYAYVSGADLQVVDISDPGHPTPAGTFRGADPISGLSLAGDRIYLADGTLQILDIRTAASPTRKGIFDIRGFAADLRVSGNYAYVADGAAGLRVIEVSHPADPRWVARGFTNGSAGTIDVQGHYAYVGGHPGNFNLGLFEVIDITDPVQPRTVGSLTTPSSILDVAVQGNYAYVSQGWRGGMLVIDVSNPARPVEIFGMSSSASKLHVAGNYLYLATSGLEILDIHDPGNPIQVSWTRGSGYDVAVSGHYAYLVADPEGAVPFQVYDVSNPAAPVLVGELGGGIGYPGSVYVAGHFAYVTFVEESGPGGWTVYDVNDPTSPRQVYTEVRRNAYAFHESEGLIYVAKGISGLSILPSIPRVQFTFQIDGRAGIPFTIESATDFGQSPPWKPLFTNTPPTLPFSFTDTDLLGQPQKFYRVRQP